MSAYRQSMRKLGARAGLLAGASAAVLAIAGFGASSAVAAPTCPEVATVAAEGSSLQKTAQGLWTGTYNTTCVAPKNKATVNYTSSSSLTALEGWGAFNGTTQPRTHQFIASDEAPGAEEIANIKKAAGSTSHVQVIPVAQAAIAIIVNPPTGCTITQIKQKQLEEVFEGTLREWSGITGSSGCGTEKITRVVRADGSGTSYQFKHLLDVNKPGNLSCLTSTTWETLQSTANNTKWPESCAATTLSPLVKPAAGGGGEEVATVNAVKGRIGYVDEATAHGASAKTLEVSNNAAETTFAGPASGSEANCLKAKYAVPSKAQETVNNEDVAGWSTVYGSAKSTPEAYPICTLTWDVAFRDYSNAGFTGFGETVKDYLLRQVLATGTGSGQAQLESNFYAPLPHTAGTPSTDVLTAAQNAATQITN
jgi:ABC-type phosphate transport system substrate-binding protein